MKWMKDIPLKRLLFGPLPENNYGPFIDPQLIVGYCLGYLFAKLVGQ